MCVGMHVYIQHICVRLLGSCEHTRVFVRACVCVSVRVGRPVSVRQLPSPVSRAPVSRAPPCRPIFERPSYASTAPACAATNADQLAPSRASAADRHAASGPLEGRDLRRASQARVVASMGMHMTWKVGSLNESL